MNFGNSSKIILTLFFYFFRCVNEDPLNGSNWYKNGLTVPIKKLTNTQLKAKKVLHPDLKQLNKPEITKASSPEKEDTDSKVEEKTVKTSYGRQSKPVLVPIKTENVRCEHCHDLFRSLYKLKRHMDKEHSDQKLEKLTTCQKVLPLGYVPAPLHGKIIGPGPSITRPGLSVIGPGPSINGLVIYSINTFVRRIKLVKFLSSEFKKSRWLKL